MTRITKNLTLFPVEPCCPAQRTWLGLWSHPLATAARLAPSLATKWMVALIRLRHLSWINSRFECMIGKWNRSKFQLYKQTHLEIHWSAVRIWGKGQFSNLRPLASSKPPNRATPSTSFPTSHNVQARWCFRVKPLYYQLLLYALSQNLPDSGLRRKNELIHVQDMVEKGKQVNTYVRNMQNCNCFHISIYLLSF